MLKNASGCGGRGAGNGNGVTLGRNSESAGGVDTISAANCEKQGDADKHNCEKLRYGIAIAVKQTQSRERKY